MGLRIIGCVLAVAFLVFVIVLLLNSLLTWVIKRQRRRPPKPNGTADLAADLYSARSSANGAKTWRHPFTPEEYIRGLVRAHRVAGSEPLSAYHSVLERVRAIEKEGPEVRAQHPHCDNDVLHARGKCAYCDRYPIRQTLRDALGIGFTGETDPGKMACPSTRTRSVETIEKWPGNRPVGADYMIHTGETVLPIAEYGRLFPKEPRK